MLRELNVLTPVPEELGALVPVEIGPTVRVELATIVGDPLEELAEGEEMV